MNGEARGLASAVPTDEYPRRTGDRLGKHHARKGKKISRDKLTFRFLRLGYDEI